MLSISFQVYGPQIVLPLKAPFKPNYVEAYIQNKRFPKHAIPLS